MSWTEIGALDMRLRRTVHGSRPARIRAAKYPVKVDTEQTAGLDVDGRHNTVDSYHQCR
jgi:hypothetical protein